MRKRDVLRKMQEEPSQAVKSCAESVKADNPDLSKDQAFAICQEMENDGQLADIEFSETLQESDPCEEGWVMVGTKQKDGQTVPNCVPEEDADEANLADNCGEGEFKVGGECKEIESVVDFVSLSGWTRQLATLDTEPIERKELDGETVRYENISLLSEGVWTDEASKTPTLYSEEGISNLEPRFDDEHNGPPLNIMHDVNLETGEVNDASHAGHVDPDSLKMADNRLVGDLIVDTSTGAGQFADDNLQSALASEGTEGFGGPSVELDFENPHEDIQFNESKQVEEIQRGLLKGVGLVMQPASKSVDFSREAARRPVALSNPNIKTLQEEHRHMANVEELREILEQFGMDTGDMSDEDVMEMASDLHEDLMGELESEEEERENAEHGDMEDDDEEEDEEMEMQDVETKMQNLEERMANLEDMLDQMVAQDELTDELEGVRENLADADTVQELQEAKEELDKRLSDIETEPQTKTLADGSVDEESEDLEMGPMDSRSVF